MSRIFFLPALLMTLLLMGCNKNYLNYFVKEALPISKRLNEGRLDNGLKYVFMHNNNPGQRCSLKLNVGTGSFYEVIPDELGMAHFIEHLAFEDRAISKDETLVEWLQKHGMSIGADANAHTSSENTIYQLDLPICEEKNLIDALAIFRSFADGLQFSDAAIEKEKNVIDAEEREFKNTQGELGDRLVQHYYSGTSFASNPIIGKPEIRAKFSEEKIRQFYRKWYQPNNMTVALVGDFGEIDVPALIKNTFETMKGDEEPLIKRVALVPDYKYPSFIIHEPEKPEVEIIFSIQPKKIIKPRFNQRLLKDRLAFDMALKLLRQSYSYQAKKTGQTLGIFLEGHMLDYGFYDLNLEVTAQKNDYEDQFKNAFVIFKRAMTYGFSAEEFLQAKNAYIDSMHQWVVEESAWTSNDWLSRIINHIHQTEYANDAKSYQKWLDPILAHLTAKDCQNALKQAFKSGNHYIFSLGALEHSDTNIKHLAQVLHDVENQKVSQEKRETALTFQYSVVNDPKDPPREHEYFEKLGIHRYKLQNNTDVLLKPTKHKADEIIIKIFSGLGFSTMTEKDFTVARLATAVLPQGGLLKHPPEQIPLLMQDKHLGINIEWHYNRLQANIATRNKDFRFALEYLKAFIDEPMYAEPTIHRIREQIKVSYAKLAHDIWAPLQHDFMKAITGNDFRVGRAPMEDLLALSRENLLSWHKEFIGSQKMNFVIVGDFDPDRVIEDLNSVFGKVKSTPQDPKEARGLTFKSQIAKIYKVPTKDETAKVIFRYPLNFATDSVSEYQFRIIEGIIKETFRLKLRENEQIIYSPSVNLSINEDPRTQNWLDIVLSVPKSKAANIEDRVKRIFSELLKSGITKSDLIKAKEPYAAHMSKLIVENHYWANMLVQYFFKPKSLSLINQAVADINAIDVPAINRILLQYFQPKNFSSAVVIAEKD